MTGIRVVQRFAGCCVCCCLNLSTKNTATGSGASGAHSWVHPKRTGNEILYALGVWGHEEPESGKEGGDDEWESNGWGHLLVGGREWGLAMCTEAMCRVWV